MSTSFSRQLGAESGVQLNPLRDNSEIPTLDNEDQLFGIMMRSTRGRIDKPFKVHRGNVRSKLGKGERVSVNALNEAWVHVVEAVNNGAYEAVVQRLTTASATINYAVAFLGQGAVLTAVLGTDDVTSVTVTNGGTGYTTGQKLTFTGDGSGATGVIIATNGVIQSVTMTAGGINYTAAPTVTITNPISYQVLSALPVYSYLLAVKHLDCHNDGIKLDIRAEEKRVAGNLVANDVITLLIKDSDDVVLHEFVGSLDPTAIDDFGNAASLTDIVASQTDAVEVTVGAITSLPATLNAYGYASNGLPNWSKSGVLLSFTEGGTGYTTTNYSDARVKLENTTYNYAYISSGGSQSVGLLAQAAQLSFDTNRQLRFDIPGGSTVDAAITFVEQLNFGASQTAHLLHAFWSPLKTDDPTGINGKQVLGVATLNIALACGRNAQTDARGFAPKNYPIAGRQRPINRTGITQLYTPSKQELNALARAKINPCIFETYTGGGRYVFYDSLTSALVESSLLKLISVADMSTSIDNAVTKFGKDILQLPMTVSIKRKKDFLLSLFEGAEAAGWIVPSNDPFMAGKAFKFEVFPNQVRPYDRVDVNYWLRYDGTTRQIFVTQTLPR